MRKICGAKNEKMKIVLTLFIAVITVSAASAQTVHAKFGKGINLLGEDSTYTMNIGFRTQSLFVNQWSVGNDDLGNIGEHRSNFLIRRARVKLKGFVLTPRLKYKGELSITNRDLAVVAPETRNTPGLVLDAVIKYEVAKNLWFWFGQTKLPGNRERIVSSANLQFVDRSLLNSRFNADRDLGFQLHYKMKAGNQVFKPIVSFTQGEGRNLTIGNPVGGYQYIGKLEWLPFGEFTSKGDYSSCDLKREATPKLAITGAYAYNNRTFRSRDQLGSFVRDANGDYITFSTERVFADMIFKYKGLSMMVEYANRSSDKGVIYTDTTETSVAGTVYNGQAISGQLGYLLESNLEFAGRITHVMPELGIASEQNQFTLGLSKFNVGHKLKFQTDLTYIAIAGSDDRLVYRMQFEMHF